MQIVKELVMRPIPFIKGPQLLIYTKKSITIPLFIVIILITFLPRIDYILKMSYVGVIVCLIGTIINYIIYSWAAPILYFILIKMFGIWPELAICRKILLPFMLVGLIFQSLFIVIELLIPIPYMTLVASILVQIWFSSMIFLITKYKFKNDIKKLILLSIIFFLCDTL